MHRFNAPFTGRVDVIGSRNRFPTGAAGPVVETIVFEPAAGGLDAVVTLGQGSQSVAALATVATSGAVTLGQGSQSVAATSTVSTNAVVTVGQGSQSVQAAATVSMDATVALGQGSQSVAALASIGGASLDAVVTLGQGSQSVAAVVTVGDIVVPPATGAGGVAGRTYVISGEQSEPRAETLDKHYVPIQREPFQEVKLKPTRDDLKALRDRLFELGRLLERKKEQVKARIKAESAAQQSRAVSPEMILILQSLIDEYELELYNQNAARLAILLSEIC